MGSGRGGHNPGPVPSPLPPTPAHPHRPIPCHRLSSAGLKQAECSSGHQQGTEGPHCSQGAPCLQLGDPAPVSSRSSRRLHNQECLSSPPCPGQAPLGSSVASTKAERRDLQGGRRLLAGRMCPRGNLGQYNWLSCPQACRWQRTVAPCLKMLNQGGKQRGRVIYAPNITEGGTISPTKFKVNS